MLRLPLVNADAAGLAGARARVEEAKRLLEAPDVKRHASWALRQVDQLAGLKRTISRQFRGQAVTNAWLKMYEMATELDLLPDDGRVFLNAELPGAFVAALHHLAEGQGRPFDWRACSLLEDGLSDQYGLMRGSPDNWLTGDGFRGDLTCEVDELVLRAGGAVYDLVTSDAGVDIGRDFDRQEELNLAVHSGQVEAALGLVAPGGTALLKTYSISLPESVALVARLLDEFATVELVKPLTSRPANSEMYLVARGRGDPREPGGMPLDRAVEMLAHQQVLALEAVASVARGELHVGPAGPVQHAWLARHPITPLQRALPTR